MTRKQRATPLIIALIAVFALTGFGCRRPAGVGDALDQPLVVWGLWQESGQIQPILDAFTEQTGVKVEYQKLASVATYREQLLQALAEGRGPDVFVIHHTWVERDRGLMSPAPPEVVDERAVQEEFVPVVAADVVRDGFVYALPTSVDTLALYVNNDILAANGVARPPANWKEFKRDVEQITRVTRTGQLQQSAAAFGSAKNINRASDILQLLMLQSGLSIVNPDRTVDLQGPQAGNETTGERVLIFYTDYADKSKTVFTWNLNQDFSIDAFAEGDTAMMINYSYHIPTVRAKNARLRFSIAPMPQNNDCPPPDATATPEPRDCPTRTFAAYWPFAVSNTSRAPVTAWQFVRFLTSHEPSELLNKAQGLPPARRDSIETFRPDPMLGPFADQALTAASWPRVDIVATDGIFNRMIDDVVTGAASSADALRAAEDQLKQLTQTDANPLP